MVPNESTPLELMSTPGEWEEWHRMVELSRIVRVWASVWGGILSWTRALEEFFAITYRNGDDALMAWSMEVWDHADAGRLLLDELPRVEGRLPCEEPRALRLLWNESMSMQYLLVQGITIIECRVSVLNPGFFSVRPPTHMEVRNL